MSKYATRTATKTKLGRRSEAVAGSWRWGRFGIVSLRVALATGINIGVAMFEAQ